MWFNGILRRFVCRVPDVIPVNWPFSPKNVPFFYGWIVWLFSTLGFLFSIPGQTMGMAVFTDAFIDVLGLSRTQLSMAYLFGTMGSAFFLTRAGRWYDRFGGRLMISISSLALGLMVFYISIADWLSAGLVQWFPMTIAGVSIMPFLLIFAGYFGVRFFGQGVLTSCSRNVLMMWFVKRRGLVSGLRGICVSIGFSLAPVGLAWLMIEFGWRGALWLLALLVGVGFSLLSLVFVRDNPQSCGLLADGETGLDASTASLSVPSKTLQQARRTPVFWIASLSLAIHAMFGTALTFHVVSIFAEAGRGRDDAFGYFLPAAVFSTTTNLVASWLVDSYRLKPFMVVMLFAFMLGAVGLLNLSHNWGFWLLAIGFGAGGGLWGVVSNLSFIRFFGPLHLGEISGLNTSVTVFASAVGPAAFSLGLDAFGNYDAAIQICLVMLVCLTLATILIRQDEQSPLAPQPG